MPNLLLQLYKPYLTPIEADEIRAEIAEMAPQIHLVMSGWPWLEVRQVSEMDVERIMESLRARNIKFRPMAGNKQSPKAKVQVSETLEVC